jgi:hypothetical protein
MISARTSGRLHSAEGMMGSRQVRVRRRNGRRRPLQSAIDMRERSLDQFLKGNSSALTFLGITLGVFISRRFFALPVAVAVMLAQETLGMAGLTRAKQAVRGV